MTAAADRIIGEWLLSQRPHLRPATLGTYGKTARLAAQHLDLYSCTRTDVQRVVHSTWRTDAGRTVATEVLRRLLGWMQANGLRDDNPIPPGSHARGGNGPARMQPPEAWAEPVEGWQRYLLAIGRSESTRHTYRRVVIAFAHTFPDGPAITGTDLIDYYAEHPHWSPATRRNVRKALADFYAWAARSGLAADPTPALPKMNVPDAVPRPVADEVYEQALASAVGPDRMMLLLGAHGLRLGEIARVHSDDVTPDGLYVIGKGGKRRLIPITDQLREALAGVRGYAFPSRFDRNRPAGRSMIASHVTAAMGRQATTHQLRHRFGSRAYQATSNIRVVQELMGHEDPKTTAIYVAVGSADLRAAVDAAAG